MTYGKWQLREDFETWVKNQHMLNRSTEHGYTDQYVHPWTICAWAAWRECNERQKPEAPVTLNITKESWDDACRGLGTK